MMNIIKKVITAFAVCSIFVCAMTVTAATFKGTATPFEEDIYGEYGKLIWKQDFDNSDNPGDYSYDADYISPYTSPEYSLGDTDYINTSDSDGTNPTFEIVKNPVTGNGQSLAMTGTSSYAIYRLNFGKGKDIISKPGKYTMVINGYKGDASLSATCRFLVNRCYQGASEMGNIEMGKTDFEKTAYSFTVCTREEFDATGLIESAFTTKNVFAFQYAFLFFSGAKGKTGYYDDIELWYEEYADITFDVTGPDTDVTDAAETFMPLRHISIKPGEALPVLSVPGSGYNFIGWSKVKDDASAIVTTAEKGKYTLYAVYDDKDEDGSNLYAHEEELTVYEAVMLLTRLDAALNNRGSELFSDASFGDYLEYAEKYNLLPEIAFDRYDRAILRSEVAEMLYAILPYEMLEEKNNVEMIPDIKDYDEFGDAVVALYKAGVFTGVDGDGSFKPYDGIRRCDFDLLMDRIFYADEREEIVLEAKEDNDIMIYDRETGKSFDAKFISAPVNYLESLGELPESTLEMGKWFSNPYTRSHMRRDIEVSKTIKSAYLEYQSDNPFDFYINGNLIPESENADGWHLTGYTDVTEHIVNGTNRLAIRGYMSDEPMKFLAATRGVLKITYTDGSEDVYDSTSGWKNGNVCSFWASKEPEGWETASIPSSYGNVKSLEMHPSLSRRSCYFRTSFNADKKIKSATLYATAKGLYVPYINGERITDARFLPGSMVKLTEYQVFDVTAFLKDGNNVIGALTGNGFYNCNSWGSLRFDTPSLMMQLEIEYTDGTKENVVTDNTWKVTASPLVNDDLQYGERYDARMEIDGWNSDITPSGEWVNASEVIYADLAPLASQTYPAVKVQDEARAVSMFTLDDGSICYDFKYNTAGRAKIVLKDTKPGEMVIIRYCEILDGKTPVIGLYSDVFFEKDCEPDGKAPYGARNIDVYICKGAKEEVYIPEFTYTGFRYIYITGYSGEYTLGTVRKIEMNTDLEERGDFTTSHEGIAKIWDATKRSYRSNVFTGPTDCPTREKNFWNGDIQMFSATACWYMDNNTFLSRWTEAGRKIDYNVYGWEDEEYILPLQLYKYYGNKEILEIKYPVIQELIAKRESWIPAGQILPTDHSAYHDHNAIKNVPADFFAAAYYCRMYKDVAEIARILGKDEDATLYESRFITAKNAFNAKYYVADKKDYTPGHQGGIVIPVAYGIADEDTIPGLMETLHGYIVENTYHLTCGFASTERILGILADYGYGEDALKIITTDTYPSILNMLTTHTGGTTTENWVGYTTSSGSSMNHYAIGGLSRWFFEHLAGLKIISPRLERISVKPYFFKELGDCGATYMSDFGLIESKWEYDSTDDVFIMEITVPEGVTAEVSLPDGVTFVEGEAGEYTNGTFTFTAKKDAFVPIKPVVIEYAQKPEENHAAYGKLVYFNNFKDEPYGTADFAILDSGEVSTIGGKHVVKCENKNTLGTASSVKVNGVEIVSASGVGNKLTYKNGTAVEGDLTIVYTLYNADGTSIYMYNVANNKTIGTDEWAGYFLDWSKGVVPASGWLTFASKTVRITDGFTRMGIRAGALDRNVYIHSIAVYVDTKDVENDADTDMNTDFLFGTKYVFPAVSDNKVVSSWTDGSNVYKSGESVYKTELSGKTLTVAEYADLSALDGKNIVCIGDSLTQGDYGSNPAGTMNVKAENYPYFLKKFTGANVVNVGKCGYSAQLYYNHLPNIADKLNDDTDIVIIMLGTNNGLTDTIDADTASGNPNTYASTQTGYYARIIEHVASKAKNAQIILMTPPVTTLRNKTTLETTCAVIKKFGEKYGLQVIDNYNNCGITYDNIKTYMPIDELHCGYDGYKLLASYVALKIAEYHEEFADSYALDYAELADEEMGFVGRWYDKTVNGVKCKATISQGAEMFFKVEGTSKVALRLHSTAQQAPTIAVSVDGSEPVRMTTTKTGDFTVAENLTSGEHYIRIIVDGFYEYQSNKWSTGDGFAVEKVVVDNGGKVTGLEPKNPVILYYGDSITEGINVLGTGSTPSVNTAIYEYPFVTSHLLGAVSYTNGFGASGVTKGGSGGVPKCLTVIDNVLADTPIDAPENPYAIVINHGHNDGSASSETFISEYKAVLARLREKYPDTPIFAVVPYAQKRVTEIKTAVDSMNDSKIFYIATKGWEYTTTDGAHPDKAGAEKLGKKLAEEMGKILKAEKMRPSKEEIANHTTVNLWHEGEVPFHLEEATNYATITPYIVEGSDEAVVIFPGGGYYQLSTVSEGYDVAKAYNEKGISAFVATYRYKPYGGDAILADGQRAVQYVRYFAEDFGINPDKIAVLGFSAGGHLATMVCQHEPTENLAGDAIGEVSSAPNAVLLGYAVTTLGEGTFYTMPGIFLGEDNKSDAEFIKKYSYSNDISKMPPAFIFYSTLDTAVNPEKNSVALANALTSAGKIVEIHGYSDGTHGIGLGKSYADFSKWLGQSVEFLKKL